MVCKFVVSVALEWIHQAIPVLGLLVDHFMMAILDPLSYSFIFFSGSGEATGALHTIPVLPLHICHHLQPVCLGPTHF